MDNHTQGTYVTPACMPGDYLSAAYDFPKGQFVGKSTGPGVKKIQV